MTEAVAEGEGRGGHGRLSLFLQAQTGSGVRAVLVPHIDSSTGQDTCSIASVQCQGASASQHVTLCAVHQRSCLFLEHFTTF